MLIAFTDYPFTELGDTPYVKAPVRQVKVGLYDMDKYVEVYYEGRKLEVKAGYLYTEEGRLGEVPHVGTKMLERHNDWIQGIGHQEAANET